MADLAAQYATAVVPARAKKPRDKAQGEPYDRRLEDVSLASNSREIGHDRIQVSIADFSLA
jgi:hypothetical protein